MRSSSVGRRGSRTGPPSITRPGAPEALSSATAVHIPEARPDGLREVAEGGEGPVRLKRDGELRQRPGPSPPSAKVPAAAAAPHHASAGRDLRRPRRLPGARRAELLECAQRWLTKGPPARPGE